MRITNQMMTNTVLMNINRNQQTLTDYEEQLSTGKVIQRPSDDPVVAVRALRFRTTVNEIKQYKTNAEDATSWASISEQAVSNVDSILDRVRELSVQASSDVMTVENRQTSITEIRELTEQLLNETNATYAGRYVFGGYKTNVPVVYLEDSTDQYRLRETFTADDIETVDRVVDNGAGSEIIEATRIRIGYSDMTNADTTSLTGAGFTVTTALTSTDPNAYSPAAGNVNILYDTGEIIFNAADTAGVPDPLEFIYEKNGFQKGDLVPDHYFDRWNMTTGYPALIDPPLTNQAEDMDYQISYSQEITVNTMANELVSIDLQRDLEEIIHFAGQIVDDDSLESELESDLLGESFSELLGKVDKHLEEINYTRSEIGTKINRLALTINRLEEDELNYTDILSENEDIDFAEVYVKMSSMETVYQASLNTSGRILQPSLLDFIR